MLSTLLRPPRGLVVTTSHLRRIPNDLRKPPAKNTDEKFSPSTVFSPVGELGVVPDREAKSISHETTFADDICDMDALRAWLMELTEQVSRRLRSHEMKGRTVHLKVRYSNFDTYTRSRSVSPATNTTNQLWTVALNLLTSELPDRPLAVRLLGMGVSNLQKQRPVQKDLFAEEQDQRDSRLDEVADKIRNRFGTTSLRRASTVQHDAEHKPQPRPE